MRRLAAANNARNRADVFHDLAAHRTERASIGPSLANNGGTCDVAISPALSRHDDAPRQLITRCAR